MFYNRSPVLKISYILKNINVAEVLTELEANKN